MCCPISVRFSPSFLDADNVKPAHSLCRSLRFLATLFISFIPVFIVCQILDGLFHSLSITLFFVLWLRSFIHLFVNVLSIDRHLSVSMAPRAASKPFAHLTYIFILSFVFWCHKQIVASLTSRPTLPIPVIIDLPYRTTNGNDLNNVFF